MLLLPPTSIINDLNHSMKTPLKSLFLRSLLLGALPLLASSCASVVGVGGGKNSFVSTTVQNSTRGSVDEAVKSVFREEGFTLISQRSNEFHFRKWGGRSAEIIYGSWLTEGVAIEPEVVIDARGAGTFGVNCDVYMREHNGKELLDANWRLRSSGKRAYNGMMKKIRKRAEARR